tara:strand:- start:2724 stop:2963 length:240 start_codon:yes stop_codon:yes gene_type:complete
MEDLHDILLSVLLLGGVFVEVSLVRLLSVYSGAREEESKALLRPPSHDPTPSEIFEVIHGVPTSDATDNSGWPRWNGGN